MGTRRRNMGFEVRRTWVWIFGFPLGSDLGSSPLGSMSILQMMRLNSRRWSQHVLLSFHETHGSTWMRFVRHGPRVWREDWARGRRVVREPRAEAGKDAETQGPALPAHNVFTNGWQLGGTKGEGQKREPAGVCPLCKWHKTSWPPAPRRGDIRPRRHPAHLSSSASLKQPSRDGWAFL